jgi:four helix bundle protein
MNSEDLKRRTKKFAHDCVNLALSLPENTTGWHIRKQLIHSSTSVAANYRAACHAQTKASFISKISIVIEESDETEFWLEFIEEENLSNHPLLSVLKAEAHELASIFITTRKTAQKN